MILRLLRHFVMLSVFVFVVLGVIYFDELFNAKSMKKAMSAFEAGIAEVQQWISGSDQTPPPESEKVDGFVTLPAEESIVEVPVLTEPVKPLPTKEPAITATPKVEPESSQVNAQKTPIESQDYSFRPLQVTEDEPYQLPSAATPTSDESVEVLPSNVMVPPTNVMTDEAVVSPSPKNQANTEVIEVPVQTSVPGLSVLPNQSNQLTQTQPVPTPMPNSVMAFPQANVMPNMPSSAPPATSSFTYTPELDKALQSDFIQGKRMASMSRYIPHSYSVQPPELLQPPSANYPSSEWSRAPRVRPPGSQELMSPAPMANTPEFPAVLPRQQVLPHGMIDPGQQQLSQSLPVEMDRQLGQMEEVLNQARTAFWQKDYANAEKLYIQLIQQFPQSGLLFGELGNVYYYQGQSEQAAIIFAESIVRLVQNNKLDPARFTLDVLWRIDGERAQQLVDQLPSLMDKK